MLTAADLIDFEQEVARRFDACEIHGPVHLNSDTQAEPLIEIFRGIKRTDYVLGTWRAHMHALLHGVPRERVMAEILAGRSMMLHFPEHRFMTSAIMGGMLPIACGLAAAGERVWCFVGDMCSTTGAFADAKHFAGRNNLPITFVTEDNDLSTNSPTRDAWGILKNIPQDYMEQKMFWQMRERYYYYKRTTQHYQPLPGKVGF